VFNNFDFQAALQFTRQAASLSERVMEQR